MSNGSISVVRATITNGNTYVGLPTWNPINFNVVTSGVGASVINNALVFTVSGPSTIAISIQMIVLTGGPINVYLGYAWDGAAVTQLMTSPVSATPVVFAPSITNQPLGRSLRLFVSTDTPSVAVNWASGSVTVTQPLTSSYFPVFTPIVPPPAFGAGGGPPPTFPPPTPPPIGQIPPGILVGPVVPPAGVPPSVAGIPQPQYRTGSATAPPANGYFPQFTTAPYAGFPNQPPNGVPIVFSNIFTMPTFAGGVWTPVPPPHTNTTAVVPSGHSLMMEPEFAPQSLSAAATPPRRGRRRVTHHSPGPVM